MSPAIYHADISSATETFGDLGLSIIGLGVEYPPHKLGPEELHGICKRHYPKTPAMSKVLSINAHSGINTRSVIVDVDHPLANMATPPSIAQLCKIFLTDGVALAVAAARQAIAEARIDISQITHVVSTTCTNSSNPGFDHFVCKALGISHQVEKVLLHGIGCSGGLASLRTAANLALGSSFRKRPARILIIALEISSALMRSELDSIHEFQEPRIGVVLFSDCASSLILSNGIGSKAQQPIYELLGWTHHVLPDTEADLGFDVDPLGWKAVLSSRVPDLATAAVAPAFNDLMRSLPNLPSSYRSADSFDWALHPGGAKILSGIGKAMEITPEHMRASLDIYTNHGNSSSATIISVLDRLRHEEMDDLAPSGKVRDFVVGCAFGPGITIEMCMLKRHLSNTNGPRRGDAS